MPPVTANGADLKAAIQKYIADNKVMVFSKSYCPFCKKIKDLFNSLSVTFTALELDQIENGGDLQNALHEVSGQKTVPNVYIKQEHIGGCDDTLKLHSDQKLLPMVSENTETYDYDLIVIGGGSGGLAASKEAGKFGKKVLVCDFVKPSPIGTTWGLGGTCVNVGCVPKKLMHQAALLGHSIEDSRKFGWEVPEEVKHNWHTMKEAIQNYIGSLNWGYRVALRDKGVKYENAYAEFVDPHTIKTVNRRGKENTATAERFLVAVGMRPRYPDIPGAKEYGITSDDLFSLPYCPGKTLVIGASYVALECAGFLRGIGLDTTVMVRSILLRGFDQQMAEKVGAYMEKGGMKFIRGCVPTKVERLEEGQPGKLRVTGMQDGKEVVWEGNTILFGIGRDACTEGIHLEKAGVQFNTKNGKIYGNDVEQTNQPHIYAIGDVLEGKLELTPVAIQAGKLLAQRLYGGAQTKTDYVNVPTTVFTPLEYGACGLSEEDAIAKYGEDNIEVYHSNFQPLEWTVPGHDVNDCYAKILCNRQDNERVVGFHVLGPNAGEITQGYGAAMKCGMTKAQLDTTIGIHPTNAEIFTTMDITKGSGEDPTKTGC
ncbi:thioredoxin reductase 1, cytoplasmic-like [Branchiostoma floridae x Branchiostoma japonicum]